MYKKRNRLGATPAPPVDAAGFLVNRTPAVIRQLVIDEYLNHGVVMDPKSPDIDIWATGLINGTEQWSAFSWQLQNAFGDWYPDTAAAYNLAHPGAPTSLATGLAVVATDANGMMYANSAGMSTTTKVVLALAALTILSRL